MREQRTVKQVFILAAVVYIKLMMCVVQRMKLFSENVSVGNV